MKSLTVNQKAKEVFKNYDVPEHLHNLTLGLIICITSDVNRKLDKAKLIVDSETRIDNRFGVFKEDVKQSFESLGKDIQKEGIIFNDAIRTKKFFFGKIYYSFLLSKMWKNYER